MKPTVVKADARASVVKDAKEEVNAVEAEVGALEVEASEVEDSEDLGDKFADL